MDGLVLIADLSFVWFIAAFIVFIGGSMIWSHFREKKRRELLDQVANDMQLTYMKDGDHNLHEFFSSAKLFSTGRGRKLTNLIKGETDEVEIAIFDYQYTTGSGKNQTTHRRSVAGLRSTSLMPIPAFTMRPEGMLDKIGGAMGFQDFDFESHPRFSDMFDLQGSNEEEVRALFTPALLEFFEQKAGITIQTVPGGLLYFRGNRRLSLIHI